MLCAVSVTVAATACHKGDDGPGTKQCFLNQRCELLEGQSAEITDTTTSVWNSQKNVYEHPVYTAKFEKMISDNRPWGPECSYIDFGFVQTTISMAKSSGYVLDTFAYSQCTNADRGISPASRHLVIDDVKLYHLRTRPVIADTRSYEREDHPYSVEIIFIK